MTRVARSIAYAAVVLAACALGGCPPNMYHALTLDVSPAGSGYVQATPEEAVYAAGAVVTLEAVANEGWTFSHWEGDGLNRSLATTRLAVYEDQTVTAHFTEVTSE